LPFFFHPDFTVGIGIAPIQRRSARGLSGNLCERSRRRSNGPFAATLQFEILKYTKYFCGFKSRLAAKNLVIRLTIVFQNLPTAGREFHPALKIYELI
jgi:hypothetical protein